MRNPDFNPGSGDDAQKPESRLLTRAGRRAAAAVVALILFSAGTNSENGRPILEHDPVTIVSSVPDFGEAVLSGLVDLSYVVGSGANEICKATTPFDCLG